MLPTLLSAIAAIASFLTFYVLDPSTDSILFYALISINGGLVSYHGFQLLLGKIDVFDPAGLFGILGFVLFTVSPAVQKMNDYWPFLPNLTNDQYWLNIWALMNLVGLAAYRGVLALPQRQIARRTYFHMKRSSFVPVIFLTMAICAMFQLYIIFKFGGIGGFVSSFTERQRYGLGMSGRDPFEDLGVIVVIAESFKFLFAALVIYLCRNARFARSYLFFFIMMAFLLAIFLVFGGLRGSRSSTLFSLIFAAGMYHFMIRRLSLRIIMVGGVFIYAFLTVYYWYKIAGSDGMAALFDPSLRASYVSVRQDPTLYVLSRDLGRMDIQSLALREFDTHDYQHLYGLTYATSIFSIIPTALVKKKPTYLLEIKTDIARGPGRFMSDKPRSTTIVFGLVGEMFVNFGYAGIVVGYALLGLLVRSIRKLLYTLPPNDARLYILPVLCLLPLQIFITDSSVVVMLLARAFLVPALVFIFIIQRRKMPQPQYDIAAR